MEQVQRPDAGAKVRQLAHLAVLEDEEALEARPRQEAAIVQGQQEDEAVAVAEALGTQDGVEGLQPETPSVIGQAAGIQAQQAPGLGLEEEVAAHGRGRAQLPRVLQHGEAAFPPAGQQLLAVEVEAVGKVQDGAHLAEMRRLVGQQDGKGIHGPVSRRVHVEEAEFVDAAPGHPAVGQGMHAAHLGTARRGQEAPALAVELQQAGLVAHEHLAVQAVGGGEAEVRQVLAAGQVAGHGQAAGRGGQGRRRCQRQRKPPHQENDPVQEQRLASSDLANHRSVFLCAPIISARGTGFWRRNGNPAAAQACSARSRHRAPGPLAAGEA